MLHVPPTLSRLLVSCSMCLFHCPEPLRPCPPRPPLHPHLPPPSRGPVGLQDEKDYYGLAPGKSVMLRCAPPPPQGGQATGVYVCVNVRACVRVCLWVWREWRGAGRRDAKPAAGGWGYLIEVTGPPMFACLLPPPLMQVRLMPHHLPALPRLPAPHSTYQPHPTPHPCPPVARPLLLQVRLPHHLHRLLDRPDDGRRHGADGDVRPRLCGRRAQAAKGRAQLGGTAGAGAGAAHVRGQVR